MKLDSRSKRNLVDRIMELSMVTLLLLGASSTHATSTWRNTWGNIYPSSTSDEFASCQLCHQSDTSLFNSYGADLRAAYDPPSSGITDSIRAVESLDSDQDPTGSDNLTEINASTQPGWAIGDDVPDTVRGDLDPPDVNEPPVADPNGPYSGTVGAEVTFDGTASFDLDGTIGFYDWDFGDGATGIGPTPTHIYSSAETFTVTLTVTDDDAATSEPATTTATIGAANAPPVADPNGPYNGTIDEPVVFDGTGSSDADGTVVAYDWDFGDDTTLFDAGPTPSHTYTATGEFIVSLTVTDDDAASSAPATTTATIGLGNLPPVADPNGPYTGTVSEPVVFDGTGSSDADGVIDFYDWNFGDGTIALGAGPTPSHTYITADTFNVTLTVTDDDDAADSASTTATIAAANQPPVADPNGPYTGTVSEPVVFDGTGSSDPDGTIVAYDWDFGDGTTLPDAGSTPSHTYAAAGEFTVTLTVTDDDGASDSAGTTATISSVGGADVFLTKLHAPKRVVKRRGRTTTRPIMAFGDGDTIEQDATVSLTVEVTGKGVQVAVDPATITKTVSLGPPATRFRFSAKIKCTKPGRYGLEWTAIIDATQNADTTNDRLVRHTVVLCHPAERGRGDDDYPEWGDEQHGEDNRDDDRHRDGDDGRNN